MLLQGRVRKEGVAAIFLIITVGKVRLVISRTGVAFIGLFNNDDENVPI